MHTLKKHIFQTFLAILAAGYLSGCNTTKHLGPNDYLLVKNEIKLVSAKNLKNRGEIKENLSKMESQKPNSSWFFLPPLKLITYNLFYKKYHSRPDSTLPKFLERPVLFDSALVGRGNQTMKNYLFNLGYYYASVRDTYYITRNKAYIRHVVTPGNNYRINNVTYDIQDTTIGNILEAARNETVLTKGKEYAMSLIDEERSRLVATVRNKGFYHFTQENIVTFQLDTTDKSMFRDAESPFLGVLNFVRNEGNARTYTEDVRIFVKLGEDSTAFNRYRINSVTVYPDFKNNTDLFDTTMKQVAKDSLKFLYHKYYVHTGVLSGHIFLRPGQYYSQSDFDQTLAKLNELGIFQYIKIVFNEHPGDPFLLDCVMSMAPNKRYDFLQNDELSSGSTYALGLSGALNFHNRNLLKGANLFTLSLNGGLEYQYTENQGKTFFNHFNVLTQYLGLNASIDFPKFIAPFTLSDAENHNAPHTVISGGSNLIDRVNYFRLINTSFNYAYNWRRSKKVSWTFSPVFFNIIRMPYQTDLFSDYLNQFPFLKNTYKSNFIEGENITFTYNDQEQKHNRNYTSLRLGLEEAGGFMGVLNQLGVALNDLYKIKFAQYTRLDFDARHTVSFNHSEIALRFSGGIGLPYGQSTTLPYIKQYFAGGPYSMRGWQIRTLGPGTYNDTTSNKNGVIDRTGDIKLEFMSEYRFAIAPLFAGAIKMNGAIFADAGNIWLAKRDSTLPGGQFTFGNLGNSFAADMGAGLRFDIATFLTFRIDCAIPVKEPNISEANGWMFRKFNFSSSSWRSDNLVVQFAIGYPF